MKQTPPKKLAAPRKPRSNAPPRLPRKPKHQVRPPVAELDGIPWRLVRMNLGPYTYGQIDDPNNPCRLIKIHSRIQCPKQLIETVVHELLHGAEWEVEESWVTRVAREVSHALFAMGARIDANSMPIIDEPETWQ